MLSFYYRKLHFYVYWWQQQHIHVVCNIVWPFEFMDISCCGELSISPMKCTVDRRNLSARGIIIKFIILFNYCAFHFTMSFSPLACDPRRLRIGFTKAIFPMEKFFVVIIMSGFWVRLSCCWMPKWKLIRTWSAHVSDLRLKSVKRSENTENATVLSKHNVYQSQPQTSFSGENIKRDDGTKTIRIIQSKLLSKLWELSCLFREDQSEI